jgi:hypothetical protein
MGTREVLAGRSLTVLRAVALGGHTIEYWQLANAVCTKEHALTARHFGPVLEMVDEYCLRLGLPRLTTLVVQVKTHQPSEEGMARIGVTDWPAEQGRCWQWGRDQADRYTTAGSDWRAALPPEPEEVGL